LHPDTLPRIWWCATGSLAFLPIHAAGVYDSSSADNQLSNYVISSYTPTVSALLESTNLRVASTFKLLSVIQPSAPGASKIPNTKEELGCIRRRLDDRPHVVLEGAEGTKARVQKGMEDCNWLHLACHGVQKPEEPTKSALILEDGHLTLEEIIRLNLPNAEFAFLSACQTTTGDENLSEEAVHIAGGMLLAGYRGVVATMWSIQDDLAPKVADEFYAHIMQDDQRPDSRKAAEALHLSVQKLRKKRNVPFTAWTPFIMQGNERPDGRRAAEALHIFVQKTSSGERYSAYSMDPVCTPRCIASILQRATISEKGNDYVSVIEARCKEPACISGKRSCFFAELDAGDVVQVWKDQECNIDCQPLPNLPPFDAPFTRIDKDGYHSKMRNFPKLQKQRPP
ncbi:16354_t:CDS:2, partial [Acaulospora colombiana]